METNRKVKALMKHGNVWRLNLELLPTLTVLALPKCPLCLMGLLSSVGLATFIKVKWLLPLTLAFVALSLIVLAFRASHRRNFKPLLLGVVAAAVFSIGKVEADRVVLSNCGLALLLSASVWSSWSKAKVTKINDCSC